MLSNNLVKLWVYAYLSKAFTFCTEKEHTALYTICSSFCMIPYNAFFCASILIISTVPSIPNVEELMLIS